VNAIIIGSAAGGGFPQWNCRCPNCCLAWAGDPRAAPRNQASLAVDCGDERILLINATPDLRAQIAATPGLWPQAAPRHSPISAVLLTGPDIDQTAGLLHLREGQSFELYATTAIFAALDANPIFDVLAPDIVRRHVLAIGKTLRFGDIEIDIFSVPGKMPIHRHPGAGEDLSVGVEIRSARTCVAYVPAAGAAPPRLLSRLAQVETVLFDGTLYSDDEMIRVGAGHKTGARMGHMPIDGPAGSLAALSALKSRRIFTHINNTNPILIDGSPERRAVQSCGWEVAMDGLEIAL